MLVEFLPSGYSSSSLTVTVIITVITVISRRPVAISVAMAWLRVYLRLWLFVPVIVCVPVTICSLRLDVA